MTPPKKGRGRKPSRARRKKVVPKKKSASPRPSKPYTFLEHPADVGFIVRGHDLPELLAHAALALCDYGWELNRAKPVEEVHLRVRAATLEDLLFAWLSEVLYLTDAEGWVFKRFTVERAGESPRSGDDKASLWEIEAVGHGEKFQEGRHQARTYVKAVTYHQLVVEKTRRGWQARVFLDV